MTNNDCTPEQIQALLAWIVDAQAYCLLPAGAKPVLDALMASATPSDGVKRPGRRFTGRDVYASLFATIPNLVPWEQVDREMRLGCEEQARWLNARLDAGVDPLQGDIQE